ncbi:recombinase family protein [Lactobacillus reuteri]|nr:recombinase family protein [Limosilactobacillus reuteri]
MTEYGYARVSTRGQDLNDQINQLENAGINHKFIFSEKFTGTTTKRPQFEYLTKLLKPGDTVVATKLDRLARNTKEALDVLDPLMDKGIKFNILNIGMLENSTVGRLVKTILLAVAEMERNMIVERTQEGKRYAKFHKKDYHEGRPQRVITPHYQAAYNYLQNHTYKDTASAFSISVSTLQRIKKQINQ